MDKQLHEPNQVLIYGQSMQQPGIANWCVELKNYSNNRPGEPLCLIYKSIGGSIDDARMLRAMHFWLMSRGHHLTINIVGCISSCAAWALRNANWVLMDEDAEIMYHRVRPVSRENMTMGEMERELERCRELERRTTACFIEDTKLTAEFVTAQIGNDRDWYIDARTAVDLELAHGLIKRKAIRHYSHEDYLDEKKARS